MNEDDRVELVGLRARVRDFIYDCTKDEFNTGWTLSAHEADDLIQLARASLQGADTVTEAEAAYREGWRDGWYSGDEEGRTPDEDYIDKEWTESKAFMRAAAPTAQDDNGVRIEAVWDELQSLLPQTGVGAELEAAWDRLQCLLRGEQSPDVPRHE